MKFSDIFIKKSREKNKKIINSFIIGCTFCPYDKKNDRCLGVVELTLLINEVKKVNMYILSLYIIFKLSSFNK